MNKAHVIIVGNEKGGAGKTTTSMHLIASLMELDFKVASIDVDVRQLSLSRYLENRTNYNAKAKAPVAMPEHYIVRKSALETVKAREEEEKEYFEQALSDAISEADFVVIDTPGTNSYLSALAHSYADTIVTPINDSFMDMDVLAKIDSDTLNVISPSIYSQMVWEQKIARVRRDGKSMNWVILRNRLSMIDAKNKRNIASVLENLAKRIGFSIASGFSERVIFRELFLQGLTLLDYTNINLTMSHIAARQELKAFIKSLPIKIIHDKLEELEGNSKEAEV